MVVTWNKAFEQRQYMAISLKAAKYYLEKAAMASMPMIKTPKDHVVQYRWTRLGIPYIAAEDNVAAVATGGKAAEQWDEDPDLGDIQHGFQDYNLGSIQMALKVMNSNIPQFIGTNLLADKREALIEKFALDVDEGMIRGIYDRTGKVLLDAGGYHAQATPVTALNGTNSNLSTKGDIWKALNKMIDGIPLGMRQAGPAMELVCSENIYKIASAPDRIYLEEVEWDYIMRYLMGDRALESRKINPVVKISNKMLDPGDTLGTHDRMALYVPNTRWLGRVVSRGFSLLGEKAQLLSILQSWGWTGSCIIDNALAAMYTEQIIWA